MQVKYTANAFASLTGLINFIEAKNTKGAGIRWLNQYEKFLQKSFLNAAKKKDCTNHTFKKLKLHCIYYKDWLIAFSINKDVILIEAILHKSRITD